MTLYFGPTWKKAIERAGDPLLKNYVRNTFGMPAEDGDKKREESKRPRVT
jgi:hypothetical protein